jgi:DHA1 family tetracycline resistance protein-like MFS transporter
VDGDIEQKPMRATIFLTVLIDVLGIGMLLPVVSPLIFQSDTVFASGTGPAPRTMMLGWMVTAFCLGQFIGAPILGAWSDRVGRKKALLATISVSAAGVAVVGAGFQFGAVVLILLGRLIYGFGSGNVAIAYSALADLGTPQSRSRDFGLVGVAFGLGFVFGPYLGGKVAAAFPGHWVAAFAFAAGLNVFNAACVALFFRETLPSVARVSSRPMSLYAGFANLAFAVRQPRLRALFAVVFFMQFGFTFFTQFFPMFLIRKFDFGPEALGNVFGYLGLWMIFTQGGVNRYLSRRTAPGRIVRVVLFTGAAGLFVLTLPKHTTGIYLLLPWAALSQGLILPNLTTLVSMQAGREWQGEILGVHQSFVSAAQALPPLIAGVFAAQRPDFPLWAAAGSYVLAGTLFVAVVFPTLRPPAR